MSRIIQQKQKALEFSRHQFELKNKFPEHNDLVQSLTVNGWAKLPFALSPEQLASIKEQSSKFKVYNAHVKAHSNGVPHDFQDLKRSSKYACFDATDTMSIKELIDLSLDERIINVTKDYFGAMPVCYSYNMWWAFPIPNDVGYTTQVFHRDLDSYMFVAVFVLLTDIGGENGGDHIFIRHTHNDNMVIKHFPPDIAPYFTTLHDYGRLSQSYEHMGNEFKDRLVGKAGDVFIADTFGIHKSELPLVDRHVCWFRYALEKTESYNWDKLHEVKKLDAASFSDYQRYVLQLYTK